MTQLAMVGDDWLSDNDIKRTQRAIAKRKKAAVACAKKLESAAEALNDFLRACRECDDESSDRVGREWDGRNIMIRDITEYAGWLDAVYGKEQQS
ncbi:hypothetical protein SAMN04244579_02428 [Azotobacter beijerinckii]|uniref:Uncharacterized protein n=1 Tax=Azotobacter beijerinckii TaxID=170623 RepID=A0A1H6UG60_9GAMM|nr:hypothetical protein [Azotobacter beijerinckii]SEI91311.1 hypothetical protein SAMN04244579_02428 [Azotobacter beijerinckii]